MTRAIAARLVSKDLYMERWTLLACLGAGILSILIAPLGQMAFYVGAVSYICVLVVLNIFVVMSGVMSEKQENRLVFLLSLPVSTRQYWMVKMAGNFAIFFVPWLILTGLALLVIAWSAIPNGMIPFTLAISLYVVCYYSVLLGVAVTTTSIFWTTTVIVAGNVSVNFFIPLVFRLPSAWAARGEDAVWSGDIVFTLIAEAAFCAIVFAVTALVQSRKRDFI